MVSILTQDSLNRLEREIRCHSGPFKDFVQGMILQKRKEWFMEHKPLSKQIVHLVSTYKAELASDILLSITAVFLSNGWLSGLNEESLKLFGTTHVIAKSYSERILTIFFAFLECGDLPIISNKEDFSELVFFAKHLKNPSFYKAVLASFIHSLSINEGLIQLIPRFSGDERSILQAYFSKKGINVLFKESKLFYPFSDLAKLSKDPAYATALPYIDVLWLDQKADSAEVGSFFLIDPKLKKSLKEVLIDGYLDPIEPVLKELTDLRAITFIDCRPTQKILVCLMGVAFKLQKIEFSYQEIEARREPLEVSSILFEFLQSKEVNFPYRKISSARA
ncbi:MAG: hypothetical protein ACK4HV_06810 [Parachlamydiaceae bacterium]